MKVTTTKEELLKAILAAAKVVPQKPAVPALEWFLLTAGEGTLSVVASDGDTVIESSCSAQGEGTACIGARILSELVRLLPSGEVGIEVADAQATVTWTGGNSTLPAFDTADYPAVAGWEQAASSDIPGEVFRTAVSHTLPHASQDPIRPNLCGIYFNPTKDGFDVVASDSRTICVYPVEGELARGFIVPSKSVALVSGAVQDTVRIGIGEGRVRFDCGDVKITSKEVVGRYPDYTRVIPTGYTNILTAEISAFLASIRRVSTCANKNYGVKMDLSPMGSVVSAQDLGFGTSATEQMPVEYEGDPIAIGFRSDLLQKAVSGLDGVKMNIHLGDGRRAALLTADGDVCKTVIMPIAIQK